MNPAIEADAPNAFVAAVQWIQGALLGSIAVAIAVLAVATVGILMFQGRIDVRRAAQVIFGCFVLFGASTIAGGIMEALNHDAAPADSANPPIPVYAPSPPPSISTKASVRSLCGCRATNAALTQSTFEVARARIAADLLPRLAELLEVSLDGLLVGQPTIRIPGKRGPASRFEQQLDAVAQLPKAQQRFVMTNQGPRHPR